MSKKQVIGVRREFLNEDYNVSLSSMVGYSVVVSTWNSSLKEEELFDQADINFVMASCYKKLDLEFNVDSEEHLQNSLHKLQTIIDVCEAMKVDLNKAHAIVKIGIERIEEIEKEEK